MFSSASSPSKKSKTPKTPKYKVDPAQSKLIKEDSLNQKLWEEALEHTAEGHQVGTYILNQQLVPIS